MAGNSSKIRVQIERCGIEKEYLLGNIQSDLRYMHFADRNLLNLRLETKRSRIGTERKRIYGTRDS